MSVELKTEQDFDNLENSAEGSVQKKRKQSEPLMRSGSFKQSQGFFKLYFVYHQC